MRPPGVGSVRRVIAIIEESRFSHERALYEPGAQIVGSPAFHRLAVAEYDEVLVVLRQTLAMLEANNKRKRIKALAVLDGVATPPADPIPVSLD